MLFNGAIVDSAMLPERAIRAPPVIVSQQALSQTANAISSSEHRSPEQQQWAGGQKAQAQYEPSTQASSSVGAMEESEGRSSRTQTTIHYHPIAVTNPAALHGSQSLDGKFLLLKSLTMSSHARGFVLGFLAFARVTS